MAIISRKVMGTYKHHCTACDTEWVSADEGGGAEAENHEH